ncbi:SUMF1/EgtB/PvdO family nonheme iron enzyme [Microvirga sp. W0021]|uniref:SUMF1/EgtB/PvdO family nonheme iron enzyme n=1 Tax=Hohaiivirga grylli TaxID=3133970 RepID=A0ABV0BK45_9HYPH
MRITIYTIIGLLSVAIVFYFMGRSDGSMRQNTADIVIVPPGEFLYRTSGEFNKNNRPIDAPLKKIKFTKPLTIMRAQVSEMDYQKCVDAGGCKPLSQSNPSRSDFPVVGVSWQDATDYANWLSNQTSEIWRLPTDIEWSYVAGSRFKDDALALGEDADFAQRWIARYDLESARKLEGDHKTQKIGSFGENEKGLLDIAGNVWEWTNSCFSRNNLNADGQPANEPFVVCGIRITAGQHRAYVSDFIRDARGGGCAAGIPPSNLGFRLIKGEEGSSLFEKLGSIIRR